MVVTLSRLARAHGVSGPFLIVAPLSTIGHWARELEAWSDLRSLTFHGSAEDRAVIAKYQWHAQSLPDEAGASGGGGRGGGRRGGGGAFWFEVVVTTYETLLLEERRLRAVPWSMLVFDEAHRLKNPESRTRVVVDGLRYEHVALLTGTPVQNCASELYSLLHLLDPRKFHDAEAFELRFGSMAAQDGEASDELQKMLAPYMLRRLKRDVLKDEIPEKKETVLPVELSAKQKQLYRALLSQNASALAKAQQQGEGGGGGGGGAPVATSLSNVFVKLRQLCNHPNILEKSDPPMPKLSDAYAVRTTLQRLVGCSGKLQLLSKLLPKLRQEGRKVLIFSQMKRMLDILEDFLALSFLPYERLDGSVAQKERQASIDRFQTGGHHEAFIFLLSTKAGGVGINLTAADTCVIFDSDWNPQNDLQGMARCHRIGQTNQVVIYRLITNGTYEKAMFARAQTKLALDAALLGSGDTADASGVGGGLGEGGGKGKAAAGADAPPSASELSQVLRQGAYAVLREDPAKSAAASKAFAEASIEELLAKAHDASAVVMEGPGAPSATDAVMTAAQAEEGAEGSLSSGVAAEGQLSLDEEAAEDPDDPSFWLQVARGAEEKLGRGARRRGQPSDAMVDVLHSDLGTDSDSDSKGDESDGYELSDAEAELKRRKKLKEEKRVAKAAAEKPVKPFLLAAAVGRRVECHGTGASRNVVGGGVLTDRGKVRLDEATKAMRKEYLAAKETAAKAKAEAKAAAEAADGDVEMAAADQSPLPPPPRKAEEDEAMPPADAAPDAEAGTGAEAGAEAGAEDAPVEVPIGELCAIVGNTKSRPKASVVIVDADDLLCDPPTALPATDAAADDESADEGRAGEGVASPKEAPKPPTRPRLISLAMLEDVEGAYAGKYDRFLPAADKPQKPPKPQKEDREPKADKGWSKADRDKAAKAVASLGAGDVPRLAALLGKSDEQVNMFVEGYLARLLAAATKGAQDVLCEAALGRAFWGLAADPAPSAEAASDGEAGGAEKEEKEEEGGTVWAMLPADAKFDEALKKNAASTLQRMVWMKALQELSTPAVGGGHALEAGEATGEAAATAPSAPAAKDAAPADEDSEPAANDAAESAAESVAAVSPVRLALPDEMERMLGSGSAGAKAGGTLPARWWRGDQDRTILEHTAAHGLSLTEAGWAALFSENPVFQAASAAAEAAMIANSSSSSAAAAAAAAVSVNVKQVLTRRDALLKRLATIRYGKPGPSLAAKRSRFFGAAASAAPAAPAAAAETADGDAGPSKVRKVGGAGFGMSDVQRIESGESVATTASVATAAPNDEEVLGTPGGAGSVGGAKQPAPGDPSGQPPAKRFYLKSENASALSDGSVPGGASKGSDLARQKTAVTAATATATTPSTDAPAAKTKAKAPSGLAKSGSGLAKVETALKAQPSLMGFFAKKQAAAASAVAGSSGSSAP